MSSPELMQHHPPSLQRCVPLWAGTVNVMPPCEQDPLVG